MKPKSITWIFKVLLIEFDKDKLVEFFCMNKEN